MTPFISQINLFGFDFAPRGWALCDGTVLDINDNQALFALINSNFGGNGQTTFALPDFRGRVPVSLGNMAYSLQIGQQGGFEQISLDEHTMPLHDHTVYAIQKPDTTDNTNQPSGNLLATSPDGKEIYNHLAAENSKAMSNQSVSATGSTTPHNNIQPSLVLNFCIALQGYFPSRN
ncbi:MAG: tail fiber protein [Candidatus Thiodiazotropha sp.]|jgi:microcystin-dependent protein